MHKLLYILIFFIFSLFSTAQNLNIDSLWNVWNNNKHDSIRFNSITRLIENYTDNNPDSVFYYAQLKYNYALKKKNTKAEIEALLAIGRTYYSLGMNDKSMECFNKCIKIYQKTNDSISIADVYNDIGNVFIEKGELQSALINYLKALKINEETKDKERIAVAYMNIGNIYYSQKKFDAALNNYFIALKNNQELNRKSGIADCYINISAVYSSKSRHEESISYLTKASKIQEEIHDELGLMFSYNNLGDNYISMNNLEKALEMLFISEKIGIEKGYNPTLSVCYINIADIFMKQNKLDKAELYLNKSLKIVDLIGYKEYHKAIYDLFSQLYEKKGNYKKAFEYQKLFSNIKDTLLNEASDRQITEMNTKYESEKKEKNIALLTKDKALLTKDFSLQESKTERQKIFNYIFIGVLLVSLVIAFILYNRFKTNQRLNAELLNKNDELSQKNALIENQKEKIIDNITYAKRIQQSILVDEKVIQSYLPNLFIYYLPKDIVSGDFYWCSKIDDNIILAAIDCTGHGVSGAFMSMIGNTLLNQIVNEKHITTPSEILRLLNIAVYEGMNQGKEEGIIVRDGMDMSLCTINYKTKQLQFAGAQNALYLINNGQLEIIKGDMHSIGGRESNVDPYKEKYTNHVISITENMSIYLFSDGYMDQFGGSNRKKFGMQQFKELILDSRHLTIQNQKEKFISTHIEWKRNESQIDDILVIGVQM